MKHTTLCYIIDRETKTKYLMLYRIGKENDPNEGKWVGVGGKVESGETSEQCLLREVREETGLTLTEWRFRGIVFFSSDEWEDEQMDLYTATDYMGELTMCEEGVLEWIKIDEVVNLPIWEGDKVFLDELCTNSDTFKLKLVYKGERLVEVLKNCEGGQ